MLGALYSVFGAWRLVFGAWSLVFGGVRLAFVCFVFLCFGFLVLRRCGLGVSCWVFGVWYGVFSV